MNAVVDTVVRREARDVYVTFRIYEGDPVRLTTLDVLGVDSILDVPALKRALPLQVGDPFNRALFQGSADTIVGRLKNRGYPYADVLKSYDVAAPARSISPGSSPSSASAFPPMRGSSRTCVTRSTTTRRPIPPTTTPR